MLHGACWMVASMDLNASPQPEDDDESFEQHFDEDIAREKHRQRVDHVEHGETAVNIMRRVLHSYLLW